MSNTPRFSSAIPDQAPDFASVMAHQPELLQRFFQLYGTLWQQGLVADDVRELTRIRNARITDCGY